MRINLIYQELFGADAGAIVIEDEKARSHYRTREHLTEREIERLSPFKSPGQSAEWPHRAKFHRELTQCARRELISA
jgi:hypothetical protein